MSHETMQSVAIIFLYISCVSNGIGIIRNNKAIKNLTEWIYKIGRLK